MKHRECSPREKIQMRWGRWILDPSLFSLKAENIKGGKFFSLPLARCDTAEEILEWIAIIHEKNWTTNKDIGDLFEALNELFNFHSNFSANRKEGNIRNGDHSKEIIRRTLWSHTFE